MNVSRGIRISLTMNTERFTIQCICPAVPNFETFAVYTVSHANTTQLSITVIILYKLDNGVCAGIGYVWCMF